MEKEKINNNKNKQKEMADFRGGARNIQDDPGASYSARK